jgi:hypothetical protein
MMLMGLKKGQAMMEYLVTYGWALLALLIVVAVLLSSGVFSPNSFATQECTFQPDLPCSPFILYAASGTDATLQFTLQNNLGFPINITQVNYTATNLGDDGTVTHTRVLLMSVGQGKNASFTQTFPGPRQPQARDFKSVYVSISYMNCKSRPCSGPYVTSGRISTFVEAG